MVYCDQDMCESKLGRLMQAFRADRPSEWQIDEFICMAEQMNKEIELLRQAEKDAARYRNEAEADKFDIGNLSSKLERADSVIFEVERVLSERQKNGFFECDDLLSEAQYYINKHQGVKE